MLISLHLKFLKFKKSVGAWLLFSSIIKRDGKGGELIQDEELIAESMRGDEEAFRKLVDQYKSYVFNSINSIVRNVKDAEDLTQETFVKVYYALPHYHNNGFKTWLTRIAVNTAIDFKRKMARRNETAMASVDQQMNEMPSQLNHTSHSVIRQETQRLVRERVNDMPANYKDVVYAYYILEKSYQEIAQSHHVKVKTVEMKLYRARQWMKHHWKEDDF